LSVYDYFSYVSVRVRIPGWNGVALASFDIPVLLPE